MGEISWRELYGGKLTERKIPGHLYRITTIPCVQLARGQIALTYTRGLPSSVGEDYLSHRLSVGALLVERSPSRFCHVLSNKTGAISHQMRTNFPDNLIPRFGKADGEIYSSCTLYLKLSKTKFQCNKPTIIAEVKPSTQTKIGLI